MESRGELPRAEVLLTGQNRALELIAGGAPLSTVLDHLTRFIESQAEGLFCSLLLLEGDCLRHGAAPSLPAAYTRLIDGVRIGPVAGSCGTAAFTGRRIVAEDITVDPRWSPYPEIVRAALAARLRACWSTPIFGAGSEVLGTFAIYYPAPSPPRPADLALVDIATHIAGIAIERHRAARALEERAARLAEVDRRKDEFLAMLAHELRNPLAAIITVLDRMRSRGGDPDVVARGLPVIERQTGQLARLVDDLLDVSRITRGKIRLEKERTTVEAAIASAVEASRPLFEQRHIELAVSPPDEPLELDADPVRLAQVLANLLNNAAKYTDPGGHVHVRAGREGGEIVISVRDDGVGIPAEMLTRIFDLFVQTDAVRERAQGGLGIGLTLVARLVEMHGGRVVAESEGPGRGSTFTVRLPATCSIAPRVAAESAPAPSQARRVLVVDDNIDAAASLADALRDAGHEVHVANDGMAALESTEGWLPDVALIDIGLPGMDGYEVARRLRLAHPHRPLVLVALTGYGGESARRRARSAGFDAHMTKPAAFDQITAAIAGASPSPPA